ncbi:hypothetical protein EUGRSUZ_C03479 [Eucalyptus grandis]|uniref:Uncharacterized protein n=2 Tax=Eucalyptus grandis TaxID=71139 RepID=A0ACC3LIN1_EUCGR|nr:hypothetical protein EUGRSUZ_C03479 [Eucalyptus grandis]
MVAFEFHQITFFLNQAFCIHNSPSKEFPAVEEENSGYACRMEEARSTSHSPHNVLQKPQLHHSSVG